MEIGPAPSEPAPALAGKRVVVLNGQPATAARVAAALRQAGAHAVVFAPPTDQALPAEALALAQQAGPFDGIVDLGLEAGFSLAAADRWESPMRRTVAVLQACYEHWQMEEDASRLFYLAVTWMDGLMGYGPGAPAEQPLGGLWSGLAKTLPQELPNCNVRVLDLSPEEALHVDRHVVAELYRWGLFEVGYHQGRRYTLQAQQQTLGPSTGASIGPGDVVLFSGGARGIGLLCARGLAETHGATVIVTGRELPTDGSEPWMQVDDGEFKVYARNQLRQATAQRTPVVIRQELTRMQRRRELRAGLDELAARGLPVHYRVCDVNDASAVRALCDEIGDALRLVIHNAGVDRPVRLAQKSAESFLATVRTKVTGFANLCAAAAHRPRLLQFCNVGSLTGRWGGMTGETDYAAANEALARLGMWAQRHALACSVKTLVWPTWDRVGIITNFAVTKRYVTPMAPEEGVRHWLRELADPNSGEVMFMGAVGRALTPIQIHGFNPILDLPNIAHLVTMHHHAGQPQRFRPFARLATEYRIDPAHAPFVHAFRLDGRPALPASMLIEHACALGAWVGPEDFRPLELAALQNVHITLPELTWSGRTDSPILHHSEATGRWDEDNWHVDVRITKIHNGSEVLRLTLAYRDPAASSVEPATPVSIPSHLVASLLPATRGAVWNGLALPAGEWLAPRNESEAADAAGVRFGKAPAADAADLWALPFPPVLHLPIFHIENVLRLLWPVQPRFDVLTPNRWRVDRILLGPAPSAHAHWVVDHRDGRVSVTDADGQPILEFQGAVVEASHDRAASRPLSAHALRRALPARSTVTARSHRATPALTAA